MTDARAILALVRRYGRTTTSFQVLEPGYRYETFGDDACVAYVDTGRAWVAAGAPLCDEARAAEIAAAFVARAREHRRRAVFFATETPLGELSQLLVGQQPVFDPRQWAEATRGVRSVREQIRRARAKGVVVTRIEPGSMRAAVDALVARWLGTRSLAPMGFLVHLELEAFAPERRQYVARSGDAIVGFLGLVPVYGRGGWFFEDLVRDPAAPNGTMELLVDVAMRDLATDGVGYATFGLAPLHGSVDPWLRRARAWGRSLYDFEGLRAFKQKLRPASWSPVHLAHPPDVPPWLAVLDALSAFSRRGLVRFGIATLLRGPDVVLRALALLLVPWTIALASIDVAHWFPSPAVRNAWVAFDLVLAASVLALATRWRGWLATALATAITADAVVTLGEAIGWNAPRVHTMGDVLVLAIAVGAPSLAALVLWRARARHAGLLTSSPSPRSGGGASSPDSWSRSRAASRSAS